MINTDTRKFTEFLKQNGKREKNELNISVPYFDIWGEDEPVDFLFCTSSGEGLIARGDIQTIKGREKQGKSAAGIVLIASALSGEFASVESVHEQTKVLWIDTEQSNAVLRKRVQETTRMSASNTDALRVVALRGYEPSERLKITKDAVEDSAPDLVFLDGVVDLCKDFNDNVECANVVSELLKVAEDNSCAIIGVIHTNKKDTEARGHLGTILQQKSAEIYEVTKDDVSGIATMKQSRSRFGDIHPIKFHFLDNFRLEGAERTNEQVREEERTMFERLFEGGKGMRYNELVDAYKEQYGCKPTKAKTRIRIALEHGTIYKDETTGIYSYLFPLFESDAMLGQNEFDDEDNI